MSTSAKAALLEEYALVARALSAPARLMILEQLAQGERAVEGVASKTGLTIAKLLPASPAAPPRRPRPPADATGRR